MIGHSDARELHQPFIESTRAHALCIEVCDTNSSVHAELAFLTLRDSQGTKVSYVCK